MRELKCAAFYSPNLVLQDKQIDNNAAVICIKCSYNKEFPVVVEKRKIEIVPYIFKGHPNLINYFCGDGFLNNMFILIFVN